MVHPVFLKTPINIFVFSTIFDVNIYTLGSVKREILFIFRKKGHQIVHTHIKRRVSHII